jgi:hypothetical protein
MFPAQLSWSVGEVEAQPEMLRQRGAPDLEMRVWVVYPSRCPLS